MMKTRVIVKYDINQSEIKKGDTGYIDGYVHAADGRPYAAIVIPSKGIVDLCMTDALETNGFWGD